MTMIVLAAQAAFFAFTSVAAFARPVAFAGALGLAPANAGGVNEVRAQYGGFFGAAALVDVAALGGHVSAHIALVTGAIIFGGLIVGRLAAFVLNGGWAGYPPAVRALLLVDSIGLATNIMALTFNGVP